MSRRVSTTPSASRQSRTRAPPLGDLLRPHPPDPGPSSRGASSRRSPPESRTSGRESRCGGTAAAACGLCTRRSGTAAIAPPPTCLWTSWRGCCSPELSPPGSPPFGTLSHGTLWRSSTEDTPRAGAPPPGQRWPCTCLKCWSPDTTELRTLLRISRCV